MSEGEIVTLIGANGAGKSTLMMTVCGNPRARDGSIVYDGEDITRLPTHEIMRRGIAQSPEGRRIFSRMTVLREPADGRARSRAGSDFDALLEQVFTLFPRLKERVAQRGGTLSGRRAADAGDRPGADVAARACCCWTSLASAWRRWWCGRSSARSAS